MAEEKKEMIVDFLKQFPDDKLNIKQLSNLITNISYPTLLKWLTVLEAEGRVRVEDYGNVKLISLNKRYYENDKD